MRYFSILIVDNPDAEINSCIQLEIGLIKTRFQAGRGQIKKSKTQLKVLILTPNG
jgi:hypothetical protein